ncbi:hypothetical protein HMPREF9413_3702 [Paenibacillus sp. HGF7]|nr:hypothetical protein HMPREF9413_3702 [Paenibacillus sp. HGF7]
MRPQAFDRSGSILTGVGLTGIVYDKRQGSGIAGNRMPVAQ